MFNRDSYNYSGNILNLTENWFLLYSSLNLLPEYDLASPSQKLLLLHLISDINQQDAETDMINCEADSYAVCFNAEYIKNKLYRKQKSGLMASDLEYWQNAKIINCVEINQKLFVDIYIEKVLNFKPEQQKQNIFDFKNNPEADLQTFNNSKPAIENRKIGFFNNSQNEIQKNDFKSPPHPQNYINISSLEENISRTSISSNDNIYSINNNNLINNNNFNNNLSSLDNDITSTSISSKINISSLEENISSNNISSIKTSNILLENQRLNYFEGCKGTFKSQKLESKYDFSKIKNLGKKNSNRKKEINQNAELVCNKLIAEILDRRPKARLPKPNTVQYQTWINECDKILTLDKIEINDIIKTIDYLYRAPQSEYNNFCWRDVILSPQKLRKHYDRLAIEIERKPIEKKLTPEQEKQKADFEKRVGLAIGMIERGMNKSLDNGWNKSVVEEARKRYSKNNNKIL